MRGAGANAGRRTKARRWHQGLRRPVGVVGSIALLALLPATAGAHPYPNGRTTNDHTITAGPPLDPAKPSFVTLVATAGDPYVVRQLVPASPLRTFSRVSLAYFGQLTDFQLADEESPARVEFFDKGANSAWRPQEAFHPFTIDSSFRQLNNFTNASPIKQGDGSRARMNFALLTGDQSDNQQFNETLWVRQLIEGGQALEPNSGVQSDYSECSNPGDRDNLRDKEAAGELPPEPIYTGVQDYDDVGFKAGDYYDPDEPFGEFADWPSYGGLMDRGQASFVPVGLRVGKTPVPTYITNGNHDGLVQGNEAAIRAYEDIANGCFKPFVSTSNPPVSPSGDPPPSALLGATEGFSVRPDDRRRFVDRVELKRIYSSGIQADDHGFAFVDPSELADSGFAATYYANDLRPGIRFISIDTVSEGGVVEDGSTGNIDDPQWQWLLRELDRAKAENKIVVVFGHHPIRSLNADVPDEKVQCTGRYDADGNYSGVKDDHGHDVNPGCDLDPRVSEPIHQGETNDGVEGLRSLLNRYPNVVAYVAGHTHENDVRPCGSTSGCPAGGNWWEVNTSAVADFPQQHRLIELMDNRDGTLSIFGTLLDFAAPLDIPRPGSAGGFSTTTLASLGRAFGYNDPQAGMDGAPEARGELPDRNVELTVDDPRN